MGIVEMIAECGCTGLIKKKMNKSDKLTLKIYALDIILMIIELLLKLQVFFSTVFCDPVYSNLQHPGFFMDPR